MAIVSSGISSLLNANNAAQIASIKAQVGENGIISGTSTGTNNVTTKEDELGKDDFLLLLVTQLRYQDPLSPMSNTDFIAQMAQFRALETNNNIQKAIENMSKSLTNSVDAQKTNTDAMTNATAISLIGKQVRIKAKNVYWEMKAGTRIPITVYLGNKSEATVQILDSNDKVIKTLQANQKDNQNSAVVEWDGTKDNGEFASAGTYKVNIVGQDKDASLYAFIQDVVTGVRFTNEGAMLKIGGRELPASDIMDVAMDTSESGFGNISPSSAVELLGKMVRVRQNMITYNNLDGEQVPITVNAPKYSSVKIAIVDSNGDILTALRQTADETGVAKFYWNGQCYDNSFAKPGRYKVLVDGEEYNPSLYPFIEGKVDGLSNLNGTLELRVNGENVLLSDVIDIAPYKETNSGNSI